MNQENDRVDSSNVPSAAAVPSRRRATATITRPVHEISLNASAQSTQVRNPAAAPLRRRATATITRPIHGTSFNASAHSTPQPRRQHIANLVTPRNNRQQQQRPAINQQRPQQPPAAANNAAGLALPRFVQNNEDPEAMTRRELRRRNEVLVYHTLHKMLSNMHDDD